MHKPTSAAVTLYVTKRFISGPLKGMDITDSMPFTTTTRAAKWARRHRSTPVKRSGSSYIVVDAAFQAYDRRAQ